MKPIRTLLITSHSVSKKNTMFAQILYITMTKCSLDKEYEDLTKPVSNLAAQWGLLTWDISQTQYSSNSGNTIFWKKNYDTNTNT